MKSGRLDGIDVRQFNPGLFRTKLVFSVETETVGDSGEITKTMTEIASAFGSIEPIRSFERFMNSQISNTTTHIIRCGWFSGVSPHASIVAGDRTFQIAAAHNVGELGRWWQIEAVEKT